MNVVVVPEEVVPVPLRVTLPNPDVIATEPVDEMVPVLATSTLQVGQETVTEPEGPRASIVVLLTRLAVLRSMVPELVAVPAVRV